MKVFTAQQMRDFDKNATEEYGIPSLVLMENAALRVVEFLEAKFSPLSGKRIVVLCGKGNNGGDGLAIARHLEAKCCYLKVLLACKTTELKGDAALQISAFQEIINERQTFFSVQELEDNYFRGSEFGFEPEIIVDALLGTGFKLNSRNEAVERGLSYLETEGSVGLVRSQIVAVDIASGLTADTGESWRRDFGADYTITLAAPKRGLFFRDGMDYSKEVWVGDIGTRAEQMKKVETGMETTGLEEAKKLAFWLQRSMDAHKGTAGRNLIIGGSTGMSGAVALASKAALGVGAGLCIAAMPEKILPLFATSILEATSHPLPCDDSGKLLELAANELPELWKGVQVVALGPGISRSDETQKFVARVVRECPFPLIIDADALHALPTIADEVKNREADTVLTPHPGEMGILMGMSAKKVNESRFEVVVECAKKYGAVVVLKGARTLVATPDGRVFVNLSGNPGMATGGSGDVLTGTIAGLLGQLKDAEAATKLGVFLHGFAGDLAFEKKGNGLMAGDIAAHLGAALVEIPKREVERINGRLRKLM